MGNLDDAQHSVDSLVSNKIKDHMYPLSLGNTLQNTIKLPVSSQGRYESKKLFGGVGSQNLASTAIDEQGPHEVALSSQGPLLDSMHSTLQRKPGQPHPRHSSTQSSSKQSGWQLQKRQNDLLSKANQIEQRLLGDFRRQAIRRGIPERLLRSRSPSADAVSLEGPRPRAPSVVQTGNARFVKGMSVSQSKFASAKQSMSAAPFGSTRGSFGN